jgi:ABC-2 type transport system permease protein
MQARSRFSLGMTAFLAMFQRGPSGDGREFIAFLLQALMQPGMIVLTACMGASFGLVMGTVIKPEQISMMFTLIFTPLLFTGCTYYPWGQLNNIRWFQVFTLFNPLTYASEGLRYAMVPPINGHSIATLPIVWVLMALVASVVGSLILGCRTFRGRVVS